MIAQWPLSEYAEGTRGEHRGVRTQDSTPSDGEGRRNNPGLSSDESEFVGAVSEPESD